MSHAPYSPDLAPKTSFINENGNSASLPTASNSTLHIQNSAQELKSANHTKPDQFIKQVMEQSKANC